MNLLTGASLLALAKSIYYCISQEEHPIKPWKKNLIQPVTNLLPSIILIIQNIHYFCDLGNRLISRYYQNAGILRSSWCALYSV